MTKLIGSMRALKDMLDMDIARYGETHSFMVRAGLLREILSDALAQGTEAGTAETATQIDGSVHDGPVAESDAPSLSPVTQSKDEDDE